MASSELSEEWRPVSGYEGVYEVSTRGRVRSLDRVVGTTPSGHPRQIRGRILHQHMKGYRREYPAVELSGDGHQRTFAVHTLVLETFVGARPEGMLGLHVDDDKMNTNVENLYWGTSEENTLDRIRNGGYRTERYLSTRGKITVT